MTTSFLIAPALLAIAAVIQALGMHQYHQDAITVTGQLFFTLFLMGLAVFYGLRGRAERFSTVRLGLLVLSVLALVSGRTILPLPACQAVAPSSAWRISSTSKRYSGSPWNSGRYGAGSSAGGGVGGDRRRGAAVRAAAGGRRRRRARTARPSPWPASSASRVPPCCETWPTRGVWRVPTRRGNSSPRRTTA